MVATKRPYKKRTAVRSKKITKKGVSSAVKRYVKRTLHAAAENKVLISYGNQQGITCTSGTTPTYLSLMPVVQQGTTQSTRIGNELKLVKGLLSLSVYLKPYDVTNNPLSTPVMVRMMILTNKVLTTQALSGTTINADLFESGSGAVALQGNLMDMHFGVNTNNWTQHYNKVFKIGAASATATGKVGSSGYFDNSSMIYNFKINYAKYIKKKIKYLDNTNWATNYNLWFVLQAVYADGTSSAIGPAAFTYVNRQEFEDM